MGSGASAPTPQPAGQVAATQQGFNTAAGQASQAGSMVNQNNQYGSLNYQQTGTSPDGTPIYTSNLQLSPQQQQLFNTLTGTQTTAGQQGQNLIQGANYGGQSPTSAIGTESSGIQGQLMNQWLQSQAPWMQIQSTQLDTKLRNQGLSPSPTATNDPSTWGPYEQAVNQNTQAQQMAVAGAASQFQPQAFSEASSLYTLPASLGMQLAQFGQPTNPGQSLVQTTGLNVAPADYASAVAQQEQIAEQNYQAQVAQNSAIIQGLFGAGGKIASAGIMASDRRLKTDIELVGQLPNGLNIYSFKFIGSDIEHIGLMADEVLAVHPEAVGTRNGYLTVNYDMAVR